MKTGRCNVLLFSCLLFLFSGCSHQRTAFYTSADFEKTPKIDVHFHYNTSDATFIEFADSLNFRFVSPNVDAGLSIDRQLQFSKNLKLKQPDKFSFFGTFSVANYGKPGFAKQVIARIDTCIRAGASGIKIWKNIGMVLKDSLGRYVMADNPAFEPIFNYLETNNIPLMGHLGEPKNCWLPDEKMTLDNDRRYFREHPEYHMYLHPEAPTYEAQVEARDNILRKHPNLNFIGAHLGSLEWSIDELAQRLDLFPNFNVDFSARIGHLEYQSSIDREKVRQFMIRYQDRLLYGTDGSIGENITDGAAKRKSLRHEWFQQWLYLATDSMVVVKDLGDLKVRGLQLPREAIDKIYCKNAERLLKLKSQSR